ncbi:hypothetical protein U9M48_042011 [Paspalum notatum var. saurae]|uniref:SIAH-type domain-containing protein n=1 Tax=Paspalum notatum var. saurae TaxID=547442 RepID=A0AAQ3UQ90_PASNO
MERVLDSIREPCPNAAYGCDAVPAYHARGNHLLECPHAPCHCPAGEACGFIGSTAALLDHVGGAHGWSCWGSATLPVWLHDGFQIVVPDEADEHGRKYVFQLNVVRHPFCRAVSVLCIRARAAAAKEIKCELEYLLPPDRDESDPLVTYSQTIEFKVECSDFSDGLPDPNENFQVIVPKYVHRDGSGEYTYNGEHMMQLPPPEGAANCKCREEIGKALNLTAPCERTELSMAYGAAAAAQARTTSTLHPASTSSPQRFYDAPSGKTTPAAFGASAEKACQLSVEEATVAYPNVNDADVPYGLTCVEATKEITVVDKVKHGEYYVEAAWPDRCWLQGTAIEAFSTRKWRQAA